MIYLDLVKNIVLIASNLLKIEELNVSIEDSRFYLHSSISAVFLGDQWLITFNQQWLEKAKIMEIYLTTFHEARHAYQEYQIRCMDKNFECIEELDRIKRWKKEKENYCFPKEKEEPSF